MSTELFITDERMFKLMAFAIQEGMFNNESDCYEKIGCLRTNVSNLKAGKQSFTRKHILKLCELTGASADYIFGFTPHMLRKEKKDPIEAIKQAVTALEEQRDRKKGGNKIANSKK